jgi:hypothetical protein
MFTTMRAKFLRQSAGQCVNGMQIKTFEFLVLWHVLLKEYSPGLNPGPLVNNTIDPTLQQCITLCYTAQISCFN